MDLDTLIIAWFCWIDEGIKDIVGDRRLRQRGLDPVLADSEVLTMEVVGEYLGLDQESALFAYFQRHWSHLFPRLRHLHRTTFVRQAANLRCLKDQLGRWLRERLPHDPTLAILDSIAIPVYQFTRAPRCQRFAGEAGYGQDHLTRRAFYGSRLHARVCWPGVICQIELTPGQGSELATAVDLTEATHGLVIGDRNFWSPRLREELARHGLILLAPFRRRAHDPWPHLSGNSCAGGTASIRSLVSWSSGRISSGSGPMICGSLPTAWCARSLCTLWPSSPTSLRVDRPCSLRISSPKTCTSG